MFCCVRTRGRREGKFDDQPAATGGRTPPPAAYAYDRKSGKSVSNGIKDGNMVVLAGAGAAVAATAATAAVVVSANESDRNNGGGGGCGVAGVGDTSGGGTSQGCCCGGGNGGGCGGCGGGCGGCGGCLNKIVAVYLHALSKRQISAPENKEHVYFEEEIDEQLPEKLVAVGGAVSDLVEVAAAVDIKLWMSCSQRYFSATCTCLIFSIG
ncbi:hypothetical protein Pfo_014202 [Paulownia fortunei]|nr:hypothetical protein Pfo_014202 [Paulownia fortunei]